MVAQYSGFSPIGESSKDGSSGERERGNQKTHVRAQPVVGQTERVVRDSMSEMGGSLPSLFSPVPGTWLARKKMRLAGGHSQTWVI